MQTISPNPPTSTAISTSRSTSIERPSDIALDTSSEAAATIDYAATPAAGNTAPHPTRNIDPVCGDAIAAPLASFFRIDLGALFALLSPPRRNRSGHATAIGRR
jgi:hypothetical protein